MLLDRTEATYRVIVDGRPILEIASAPSDSVDLIVEKAPDGALQQVWVRSQCLEVL